MATDVAFYADRLAQKEHELNVRSGPRGSWSRLDFLSFQSNHLLLDNERKFFFQELQATFNKYKLKNKVKFDQLRKEVTAYCSDHEYSINDKEVGRTSCPDLTTATSSKRFTYSRIMLYY